MADVMDNFKNLVTETFVEMKKYAYIVGILMVGLGVLTFLRPISTSTFFIWVVVFALIINGFSKLFVFFKLPKEMRSGWTIALAIIWIFAAIMLICQAFSMPLQTSITLDRFVGFIIAFNCIFSGVSTLCASGEIKARGGSQVLAIISGILEIICGCIVMSAPLLGLFVMTIAFGIYMVVMGIAIIIRAIAY